MAIEYMTGSLFNENGNALVVAVDSEAIVNTVNCKGVMGAGIAKQFKDAFRGYNYFKDYKKACEDGRIKTGRMFVYETEAKTENMFADEAELTPRYIINFPTKDDWRDPSRMRYIEDGLKDLVKVIREKNIKSIAMPALGCGLGGLDWHDVRERIKNAFKEIPDVEVIVYEPR